MAVIFLCVLVIVLVLLLVIDLRPSITITSTIMSTKITSWELGLEHPFASVPLAVFQGRCGSTESRPTKAA
ncbi:MAG TPA: hypothetical protein VGW39_08585 [Chthoniobacterales bacterium]|nr:hypothetical protein [Chthoniobacterales bacterium]